SSEIRTPKYSASVDPGDLQRGRAALRSGQSFDFGDGEYLRRNSGFHLRDHRLSPERDGQLLGRKHAGKKNGPKTVLQTDQPDREENGKKRHSPHYYDSFITHRSLLDGQLHRRRF